MLNNEQTEIQRVYDLCKLQASTDDAFPEDLLKHWFEAAWDLCASTIGLVYPAQQIEEPIVLDNRGNFKLSHQPSGAVEIFNGFTRLMVLPPSLLRSRCDPSLCCYCNLWARYTVGNDNACDAVPPRFAQAVARLFTYMVENRGDAEMDDQVLAKCGALRFLSPDLTYVA